MNRRARRRAARVAPRPARRPRRPLPPLWRLVLLLIGVGLIVGGVVLAAHGSGARGGRVIGAIALAGVLLVVVAWQGRT